MISYHGTTGRYIDSFLNGSGRLFPRSRAPIQRHHNEPFKRFPDIRGWGPIGLGNYVYVSDCYAIAWALWRRSYIDSLVVLEVSFPDHFLKLAAPDITWLTLNNYPNATFEDLGFDCPPHSRYHPPIQQFTWRDSYKSIGSFSIYLPEGRGLQVNRVFYVERKDIPHSDIMYLHSITPDINATESLKDELREFHRSLFDNPPSYATVYDFRADNLKDNKLQSSQQIVI